METEAYRFWTRVTQGPDGCWLWTGGIRANGYGTFAVKSPTGRWTQTTAHRWSYQTVVEPAPDGYEIDHLCRVRGCVRPDHLEAVSVPENRRRRDVKYAPEVPRTIRAIPRPPSRSRTEPTVSRTHCKRGHEYAVTGWAPNGKGRLCRGCHDDRVAAKRKGGAHGTKTHCPQGHPYSPENTYLRPRGGRECRTCVLARNRLGHQRRRRGCSSANHRQTSTTTNRIIPRIIGP